MARKPLILVGAGGLAREAAEVARAGSTYNPVGYLDDDPAAMGDVRAGLPVLGPVHEGAGRDAVFLICPGKGAVRLLLEQRLVEIGVSPEQFATVVHPSAVVPASAEIGSGTLLLAGTVLTADVILGRHVVVMPNAVLTHDDDLANGVTVCAAVALAGGVQVGTAAYLGAGALVRENIRIGENAVLGQGSVVVRDVPDNEVWVGNPAQFLRAALPSGAQPTTADHRRPA